MIRAVHTIDPQILEPKKVQHPPSILGMVCAAAPAIAAFALLGHVIAKGHYSHDDFFVETNPISLTQRMCKLNLETCSLASNQNSTECSEMAKGCLNDTILDKLKEFCTEVVRNTCKIIGDKKVCLSDQVQIGEVNFDGEGYTCLLLDKFPLDCLLDKASPVCRLNKASPEFFTHAMEGDNLFGRKLSYFLRDIPQYLIESFVNNSYGLISQEDVPVIKNLKFLADVN